MVLSGCGTSGHSSESSSPTPVTGSTQFTPLNLGLPSQALKAPVTGRVPDGKVLHVGVTLKVSDATWQKLGHGKSPAQSAGDIGKQLGLNDAQLQKLQAYLAAANIQAKPSKTHTSLTFDVNAASPESSCAPRS